MAVGDAYVFPGFLTPVLTQLFFPKPLPAFLTCFCRGERRKYARKKSPLNRGSNSQPPGHESATLTTEPPGRGRLSTTEIIIYVTFILSSANAFKFKFLSSGNGLIDVLYVDFDPYTFINPLPNNHDFYWPWIRSLLKTLWEKEKMLVTSIFSFFHNVFYPSQNKFHLCSHIYFVICKCFPLGPVWNFVAWQRVK